MTDVLRRSALERAVQLTIAAVLLVSVLAAGSLLSLLGPARFLRWPLLLLFCCLAVAFAWRRRRRTPSRMLAAAAATFVGLALLSPLWSAEPWLSGAHAGVLALLFAGAGALAWAAWADSGAVRTVLDGVLLGLAAVGIGGLLVLLFEHDRAVMPATSELPARYQGLGGGPNTATMLMAVGVPLAAQATLVGTPRRRIAAAALLLLLLGSIVASGSRGAFVAAFAGLLAAAALVPRRQARRAAAAAAVAAAFVVALALMRLPDPLPPGTPSAYVPPYPGLFDIDPKPGYVDANLAWRLQDDVGHPPLGVADTRRRTRTLLSSSGRAEAWEGTWRLVEARPLVGYGFGLEDKVFVDRYTEFNSNVPENSYLGLLLQLGVAGAAALAVLIALVLGAVRSGRRLEPGTRVLVAGCAGAIVAGLVLAGFQSYLYAVGNNATATFWIAAFLLPAAAAAETRAAHA